MNIRIHSDLHLESNHNFMLPVSTTENEKDIVLILAGDIVPYRLLKSRETFFIDCCNRFKTVLYVAGNHEYYGGNFSKGDQIIATFFDSPQFDNLHYLNKESIVIDNTLFIGCTLWTDCDNEHPIVMSSLSHVWLDYDRIKQGVQHVTKLTATTTVATHKDHLAFIKETLLSPARQKVDSTVVITHFSPSYAATPQRFIGDQFNPFFHSNLNEFILDHQPTIWIHGHIHNNVDYAIDKTRVICNPLGHRSAQCAEFENLSWIPELVISI